MVNNLRIGAIIQARFGSSRFPGKIIKKLPYNYGPTIIEHIVRRARSVPDIDEVILATSKSKENDVVEKLCRQKNISIFRGEEDDVLSRFWKCCHNKNFNHIYRLTGDNPFIDPVYLEKTLYAHIKSKADYTVTEGFPLGMNIELLSIETLEYITENAKTSLQREHVTKLIYDSRMNFKVKKLLYKNLQHSIRLTIDYPSDYALACVLYDKLYGINEFFGIKEIIEFVKKNPWIKFINENNKHNSI